MSTITNPKQTGIGTHLGEVLCTPLQRLKLPKASVFGLIIVGALIAFEIFNFSTTEFALSDLLGNLSFAGIGWATILALAFCGMDFAGIARLFSPQHDQEKPFEIWYLLGAWFLAATMNAILTWWAVSVSLLQHTSLGNEIVGREALLSSVPVFVAMLVWLIRVLMIGSFTISGTRMFVRSRKSYKRRSESKSSVTHTHHRTGTRQRTPLQTGVHPETVRANNGKNETFDPISTH